MLFADVNPRTAAFALMLGGAVALYAASLIAVRALAGSSPALPGRRAVGHWLPIFCVVMAATLLRRADIAVGVVFATCVASLSLMLGILAYFAPLDDHPAARRGWPFVLPAALLAMLAGLTGRLSLFHAGVLLILGLAVWSVWTERRGDDDAADVPLAEEFPPRRPFAGPLFVLALVLAAAGGCVASLGATRASETSRFLPAGLLAAAVLSPLLTMPMLATSSALAERGHSSSMAGTLVAVALLNLCVTLPAAILVWHVQPGVVELFSLNEASTASSQPAVDERYSTVEQPFLGALGAGAEPMPYPMMVWRVDTVLVLVLGFALIPISLGRWSLGKAEATGLIFAYALYLMLTMWFSRL